MSMERWPECLLPVDESAERKQNSRRGPVTGGSRRDLRDGPLFRRPEQWAEDSYYPPWRPAPTRDRLLCFALRPKCEILLLSLPGSVCGHRRPNHNARTIQGNIPFYISGPVKENQWLQLPRTAMVVWSCAWWLVMPGCFVARAPKQSGGEQNGN